MLELARILTVIVTAIDNAKSYSDATGASKRDKNYELPRANVVSAGSPHMLFNGQECGNGAHLFLAVREVRVLEGRAGRMDISNSSCIVIYRPSVQERPLLQAES